MQQQMAAYGGALPGYGGYNNSLMPPQGGYANVNPIAANTSFPNLNQTTMNPNTTFMNPNPSMMNPNQGQIEFP